MVDIGYGREIHAWNRISSDIEIGTIGHAMIHHIHERIGKWIFGMVGIEFHHTFITHRCFEQQSRSERSSSFDIEDKTYIIEYLLVMFRR